METITIGMTEIRNNQTQENLTQDSLENSGIYLLHDTEDLRILLDRADLNGKWITVCGANALGIKVARELQSQGSRVTILEAQDQLLPGIVDKDFSPYIERQLRASGLNIVLNQTPDNIELNEQDEKVRSIHYSGLNQPTDLVLFTEPDTAQEQLIDLNNPQNNLQVGVARSTPRTGTGITATETVTNTTGNQTTDTTTVFIVLNDQPLNPEHPDLILKLEADPETRQLNTIHAMGEDIDQAILDEANEAIVNNSTVDALSQGNPDRPLTQACQVLQAKLDGEYTSIQPEEYTAGQAKDYTILDCSRTHEIFGATPIDMDNLTMAMGNLTTDIHNPTTPIDMDNLSVDTGNLTLPTDTELSNLPKDKPYLLVCSRGRRANTLQQHMRTQGFTNTHVLEGGLALNNVTAPKTGTKLTPAQIKAVKGMGCLQDKRYEDVFNVRVITRNGKITAAEQAAIAEAAERYGSSEITMTSRLTLEIQGVRFDNIPALRDFLATHGLETGGTGSKVRPVVSCKGTTCQYGLIDTFSLSEKIHDRFYKGFSEVTLPHKFKIAVGGCPNNCVKPDLNDIGILGQRVPRCNLDKCRSCKVCNVEKTCPMKVAHTDDAGKVYIDMDACNHCGLCIKRCPFGAIEEVVTGYKIFIGGRWGKKGNKAAPLEPIFTTEEEVLGYIERIILFYRDEGITGDRFGDTIDRLGFDYVSDKILYGSINKDNILTKSVVGGAAC